MADSISIVMTMNEDVTSKLKSIASTSQGCSKELEELGRKTQALGERYTRLNENAAKAAARAVEVKKAMNEAAKAFRKSGDAADQLSFEKLREEYHELTDSAQGYQTLAKSAMKDMSDSYEAFRKMDAGLADAPPVAAIEQSLSDKLAKSGLYKMFGDSLANAAGVGLESALGQPMATLASSVASGMSSGAAAGALFGNPLLGAGIGAAAGLITGGAQIFGQKDEAFKAYYKDLYETVSGGTAESVAGGSDTAAKREQDVIAFNTMLGEGTGTEYLRDLQTMAAKTPMEYGDLTGMSRSLATGFRDDPDRMLELMTSIGNAGSAVGIDAGGMNTIATALARMQSSGKTSLEYINLIQERGVDAIGMLASGLDKTKKQIYDMISKGEIDGVDAVNVIQAAMDELYDGAMEKQSRTFSGLASTLNDTMADVEAAGGEAYNEMKDKGMQADIDAYGGELGDALKDLNGVIGQNTAYMENLQGQYAREALSALLLGDKTNVFNKEDEAALAEMRSEYLNAKEAYERDGSVSAALQMKGLKETAEAMATAAYESSDQAKLLHDAENDEIGAIRELTAAMNAATLVWEKGNAFTKGGASWFSNFINGDIGGNQDWEGTSGPSRHQVMKHGVLWPPEGSNAFGLERVPREGLYYLHQDERVQTAAEARRDRGAPAVTVTGNEFVVRKESDIDAIAAALAGRIELARQRAGN